jgi:uncharacterized protein
MAELRQENRPKRPLSEPGIRHGRHVKIDILRGVALFGVLLANLQSLTYPGIYLPPLTFANHTTFDRAVEAFIRSFAEGSFYPLFATLFGLGFAMQMKKPVFTPSLFRRRLVILLSFGLLHAAFVWEGDILVAYALLGLVLIPLRYKSARTLLLIISGCLIYSLAVFYAAFNTGGTPQSYLELVTTTYAHGSYLEATQLRFTNLSAVLVEAFFYFPHILACFLFGLLIGRRGVAQSLSEGFLLRHALALSLSVALPIATAYSVVMLTQPAIPAWLAALDTTLGSAALGFAYAATLLLLLQRSIWQQRLEPLGFVGRTSLSNYLLQSFIFTSLYYGYGGGLYARVPLSVSVLLSLALYTLQLLASRWWLSQYTQGPMEALWHRLTYNRTSDMLPGS